MAVVPQLQGHRKCIPRTLLKSQLGVTYFPPCFPLQHCGINPAAVPRQLLHSSLSKSGVHSTSVYIVWKAGASALPAANLRAEFPDAAQSLSPSNKGLSTWLNPSTSETFAVMKTIREGEVSITPNMDLFEYRSIHLSGHMIASFWLGQYCKRS